MRLDPRPRLDHAEPEHPTAPRLSREQPISPNINERATIIEATRDLAFVTRF
jgi:hypothetical protein